MCKTIQIFKKLDQIEKEIKALRKAVDILVHLYVEAEQNGNKDLSDQINTELKQLGFRIVKYSDETYGWIMVE